MVLEVAAQLGDRRVRTIAMDMSEGAFGLGGFQRRVERLNWVGWPYLKGFPRFWEKGKGF